MASDKTAAVEQRLNDLITGDSWHQTGLNAGWSSALKYRFGMDLRHVHLKFTDANPHGHTANPVIATLPAAYRPNAATRVALTCGDSSGGGWMTNDNSPHMLVGTDGTCTVYGVGGLCDTVSCNAVMAIFDD